MNLTPLPDANSRKEISGFLIRLDAVTRLEGVDAEAAAVIQVRFFAWLSIERIAAALGTSACPVKRTRTLDRGWLKEASESGRV